MSPAPFLLLPKSPLDLAPHTPAAPVPTGSNALDGSHAPLNSLVSLSNPDKHALVAAQVVARAGDASVDGSSWAVRSGGAAAGGLVRRSLAPNDTQKVTLGVIGAFAVIITILWNLPVVKWVLWPFKLLVVAFHEFSHAAVGCCTGAKVRSITLDPREGGCTMMQGGIGALTLPAGYLGSSLIGALLVFCGFDVVASKVASIVVGVMFLLTLWWGKRDWLTILTILLATGFIVACWFIAHGAALRFYMLFLGVMNALYSLYDICDDLIFRKVNESDASVFAKRYGGSSACWGVIWFFISIAFLAAGIIAGLAAFDDSFSQQAARGAAFLPTRS
ncbi:hypothetical protein JCM3770_003456 [Rhodotorula araucariae]